MPAEKVDGKAGKPRKPKRVVDDEDEEIPEDILPLLDDEVEFMKEFIEEEVTRRIQEIEIVKTKKEIMRLRESMKSKREKCLNLKRR